MSIILSDGKGHTWQLIPKAQSSRVNKTGVPNIHTLSDARSFLNRMDASAAFFWKNIWKQLNPDPTKDKNLTDKQTIEKIAPLLKEKQWLLSADNSVAPSPAKSTRNPHKITGGNYSGGRGGSSGGSGGSVYNSSNSPALLGPATIDRCVADASFPASTPTPGEDNAITSATPSKVSDDSDTAVVVNEDETTRGCPISMVSGEEVLPLSDFSLPGPVALEWKRFYRTGHSRDSGLGH
ncbi:hypothetical protein MNBD_GAMMA11-3110, partial [hydrothermal vent metagenome]